MRLKQIIYHCRPINLVIVAVTQLVILFFLFSGENLLSKSPPSFHLIFGAIITCTLIITIGGYIINDYFDYEIDSINKLSLKRLDKIDLLPLYFISLGSGLLISYFVANHLGNPYYIFIYLLSVLMLFMYATHFKRMTLIGNFIVSLFSSLVIVVIWFVFELSFGKVPEPKLPILILFLEFIFLSSMAREIVKDCQDIEGDSLFGLKTLAIKIGTDKAAFFAIFFMAVLLLVCSVWLYFSILHYPIISTVIIVFVVALILLAMAKTWKAKTSLDFKSASGILKSTMALGIIYLLVLTLSL